MPIGTKGPCALILCLSIIGCTTVPNNDAAKIAKAGQEISTKASTAFSITGRDVSLMTRRDMLVDAVELCRSQRRNLAPNAPSTCTARRSGDAARKVEQSTVRLQALFANRANAWSALSVAYEEFQKEAEHDAGADMEAAVKSLTGSLDGLGVALSAFPGISVSSISPLEPILTRIGGQSARSAQLRRIQQSNEQLIALNDRFVALLKLEKLVVAQLGSDVDNSVATFENTLLVAGIVDPAAILTPVTRDLGRELSANANGSNPLAVVAAQSWLLSGQIGAKERHLQTIDQLINALEKLSKEQKALKENRTADLAGISAQIQSITAWISAANEARHGDYSGANGND
jgi:hypothetical protein